MAPTYVSGLETRSIGKLAIVLWTIAITGGISKHQHAKLTFHHHVSWRLSFILFCFFLFGHLGPRISRVFFDFRCRLASDECWFLFSLCVNGDWLYVWTGGLRTPRQKWAYEDQRLKILDARHMHKF